MQSMSDAVSVPLPATLPEDAVFPDARAAALRDAQETHVWDWSWPPGCATLSTLPDSERYGLRFVAETAKLQVEVAANHAAVALDGAELPRTLRVPSSHDDLLKTLFSAAEDFHVGAPRTRPGSPDGYARYFAKLPAPPLLTRLQERPEEADLLFAWQRVAGANPMALHRVARVPDDMPVTEQHWSAAGLGETLASALDDGRVFAVDYTLLHGAPATRYLGRQKYLCGARALFTTVGGPLRPVAIQLEPGAAVTTPADGAAWAMARFGFNVADANAHETMEHLGATHLVMEALGIGARRNLAPEHPLRRLVEPHLVGTFAINHSAKTSLIAPGGVIDKVFAARIDVAASLVRVSLDRFVLQDRAPAKELAARGLDDRARMPENPYRDDVTAVYDAIARFCDGYVRTFYADDAAVARDVELRAWVAGVASPIGGALKGVRPVETLADLATWMANLVHIASAQHAAVNFPQYPYFGWGANTAGACWGPLPTATADDASLLALMPPWDCIALQTDTVYQLSSVYYNHLGDYGLSLPLKVAPLVSRFADELAALDARIAEADATRRLTYPFLRPSLIPASINI